MKVLMSGNSLRSLTIQHLQGWIEALEHILDTDEPFEDADALALQLDHWREEFQKNCGNHTAKHEPVIVLAYGNQVILICNQKTGEYIKLTVIPTHLWSPQTS